MSTRYAVNLKVLALILLVALAPTAPADIEIEPNGLTPILDIEIEPNGRK